jgi:hypothetical protein
MRGPSRVASSEATRGPCLIPCLPKSFNDCFVLVHCLSDQWGKSRMAQSTAPFRVSSSCWAFDARPHLLSGANPHAESLSLPLVRWRSRRGCWFLCLRLQELEDRQHYTVPGRISPATSIGNDCPICPRWARIPGPQRRSEIYLLACHFLCCELRDASGGRWSLGEALSGRRRTAMRMAEGQIWSVVANRSKCINRNVECHGYRGVAKSRRGDASNEEARHFAFGASLQKCLALPSSGQPAASRGLPLMSIVSRHKVSTCASRSSMIYIRHTSRLRVCAGCGNEWTSGSLPLHSATR